jgi:hypothetical protein
MSCNKFNPGDLLRVVAQPEENAWGWSGTLSDVNGNLKESAKVVRQIVEPGRIVYALDSIDTEGDEPQGRYVRVMLDGHTLSVPGKFLTHAV